MHASAIILDMDGLMLDTERVSYRVWKEAALELGCMLDETVSAAMVGLNEAASRALLRHHFGDDWPADALCALAQQRYREHLDRCGVPKKPGLDALLDHLRAREVPRAVATSTASTLARHKLERAGVLGYFDVVVGGDEVARGKPAPDIFLLAAERLGVDPARCIVFEDSGPGIAAASAAGMIPVLVPDLREPLEATRRAAFAVVESLAAAIPVVDRLLAPK